MKTTPKLRGAVTGAAVAVAALGGGFLAFTHWTAAPPPAQGRPTGAVVEVDFGLAEIDPGQAAPVTSYKKGGPMRLYAGDEVRFTVMGDAPLPVIELRAGSAVQVLPGTQGAVKVDGVPDQPVPAVMVAQGTRVSLPGGAPPRVSVKVQVFAPQRPG